MSFAAVDVETANADLASICQIGIVRFNGGEVQEQWQSLIDPEDEFDGINVSIHGIDETTVRGAPRFGDVASRIASLLAGQVVVSHMALDRVALSRVHEKYQIPGIQCRWLDSARVCRRAWAQFSRRGYGLADVAAHCGIVFRHHDALEDARAAGQVLLRAISETGLNVDDWLTRADQPIDPQGSRPRRPGNPDGELFGEVVVFTGALSIPRREAADMAASAGCDVVGAVGKNVTLLVVGDQDVRKFGGQEKSSKHRKAGSDWKGSVNSHSHGAGFQSAGRSRDLSVTMRTLPSNRRLTGAAPVSAAETPCSIEGSVSGAAGELLIVGRTKPASENGGTIQVMSIDDIEAEVLRLDPQARARLAKKLLESLEALSDEENDDLWAEEADRRDAAWDSVPDSGRSAADVLRDARARLR